MNAKSYLYNTHIEWAKRRRGRLHTPGLPDLMVSIPPEFNGEPGFWTPEHLFVAAAESCLMATFLGIAENSKLAVVDYRSMGRGKLEWVEGVGLRFTELEIFPAVQLEQAADRERAERLMAKAVKGCLIANSINAIVRIEPAFVVGASAAA